jgi:indolepyruvate ferredoxin oxidoreductase
VLAGANAANFDTAVQLLSLPKKIKGFGHVKESKLAEVRKEQAALLDQFVNPANAERAAA